MRRFFKRITALLAAVIIMIEAPMMAARVSADPNPGAGDFVTRLYNYALGKQLGTFGFSVKKQVKRKKRR